MWLLIDEQTNRVLDIQEQPHAVAPGWAWIEDKSVTDRSKAANFTYDRQGKKFTEIPKPPEPRDLVAEKLASLEAQIAEVRGEPVIGIANTPDPSFNPLYLLAIPLVVGAYFLGKK